MTNSNLSFIVNMQRLKKLYDRFCRPVMTAFNLTKNEVDVLLFLANNKSYDTARDMVELRGLAKSQVCKSVDSLIRRRYLQGQQDPKGPPSDSSEADAGGRPGCGQAQEAQRRFKTILYQGITPRKRRYWIKFSGRCGKTWSRRSLRTGRADAGGRAAALLAAAP